ncbi:MAG: hypothetical protein NUW01_08040, partial [Gemmatimonadaceae bacterium]|nr:hypothetical protein [Gemmatimonadaceae bacterium]
NLPWVSREAYDEILISRASAWTRLVESEGRWAARYEALLDRYTKLAEREHPEPPKLPARSRDQVIEAIVQKAGNNGALRAHLGAWAAQQRRDNVPEDTIVEHILVWASPDEESQT